MKRKKVPEVKYGRKGLECCVCIHPDRMQLEQDYLSGKILGRDVASAVGCSGAMVSVHFQKHGTLEDRLIAEAEAKAIENDRTQRLADCRDPEKMRDRMLNTILDVEDEIKALKNDTEMANDKRLRILLQAAELLNKTSERVINLYKMMVESRKHEGTLSKLTIIIDDRKKGVKEVIDNDSQMPIPEAEDIE
jgi:hypothetical protein